MLKAERLGSTLPLYKESVIFVNFFDALKRFVISGFL
jgi:hypothetical protein